MRFKVLAFSILVSILSPSMSIAQTVDKGYTILPYFTTLNRDAWVAIVQEKINSGYQFYAGGQVINDRGAEQIVSILGSYYLYVYGPLHHEVASPGGNYRCVYIFNYDDRTNTAGSGLQVCGNI